MIVNQIEQRVYVGFSSSKRKISRLWIGEGENSRTGGGWVLRIARARIGGPLTTFGKSSFALLGEKASRAGVAGCSRFVAGTWRQLFGCRDVTVERIRDV